MLVAHILNSIEGLVIAYGAVGIFFAAFVEEAFIPFAATVVMVMSGFFVLGGTPVHEHTIAIFFTEVVLPVSAGFTLGTLFVYGLFYRFGEEAVKRFGKYLHLTPTSIKRLEERLSLGTYDELLVFFARAVPLFPSALVNAFCGLMKWSPLRFILITFCGIIIRATMLGFIGWQIRGYYRAHLSRVTMLQDRAFAALILLVVVYITYLYVKKRRLLKQK
jgi:membrane protein DedA with SNARE-associated domain